MQLKFKSYRTSKSRLWNHVKPMSEKEFANLINPIISEKRNLELDVAKQKQYLQSNEVLVFLNKIGADTSEHGKLVVLDTLRTTKKVLRERMPYQNDKVFQMRIIRIMATNRRELSENVKLRRYLMPNEVISYLEEIGEVMLLEAKDTFNEY